MSAKPIKTAVQYLGGTCLLSFFVALLTFIFSFLGTIFCAALAGMMLGALKQVRWHALAVSLLFPLVTFALLRGLKAELPTSQLLIVAAVCFATFWVCYLVGATLFSLERKRPIWTASTSAVPPATDTAVSTASESAGRPLSRLTLDLLQGKWSCTAPPVNGEAREKTIEIDHEHLVLRVTDASGRLRVLAHGQVELGAAAARQSVTIAAPRTEPDAGEPVSI